MKPQELRIGNFVYHKDNPLPQKVDGLDLYKIQSEYISEYSMPDKFTAIPLTEEWLLKFGFKKEDKSPTKEHSNYFSRWVMDYKYSFSYAPFRQDWGFYHSYTDAPNDADNERFDFISCGIKYVHQLQNLYFALTGEEL